MKRVEKQDLIKWASIFMLISVVLAWIVEQNQIVQGVLTTEEISTVGIFQLAYYFLEGFAYVTQMFPIIFIVPGFYAVLGATKAYSKLTDAIAQVAEKHLKIFVAVSMLIYACLAGVSSNYISLIALIPFSISIMAKMKVDKITAFASTFGGILVGILGATYSTGLLSSITVEEYGFGVSYGYELVGAIVLFALAYVLLTYFVFNRLDKNVKLKEEDLLVDPFASYVEKEKDNKKKVNNVNIWPLAITLIITFVITILAFIGWEDAFGVSLFADIHEWVMNATLFGKPIYSYILGVDIVTVYGIQPAIEALGAWSLVSLSMFLVIMLIVVKILYRIPLDVMIDNFVNGVKKSVKPAIILAIIYTTVYISIQYHSTVPYFVNSMIEGTANVFTAFLSGGLMSIFSVEFSLVIRSIGSIFSTFKNLDIILLALQAAFGFISFIAPTSVVLMLGLSTLDIKFKDYFKFIWKFLLALLVIIIAVLAILMYL